MKQITNKTILKQGDKTYQPIEINGVIYWVDKEAKVENGKLFITKEYIVHNNIGWNYGDVVIVAQSEPKLDGIPIVSLDSYVERLAMDSLKNKWSHLYSFGYPQRPFPINYENDLNNVLLGYYKSNPNQYTQADIEKAIWLARDFKIARQIKTVEEILEIINSISVIEVDEQFNVISYG
jgi:hypothetical protein